METIWENKANLSFISFNKYFNTKVHFELTMPNFPLTTHAVCLTLF